MAAHPIPPPRQLSADLTHYVGVMKKGIFLLAGTKDRPMLSGIHQLFAIEYILGETMGLSRRKGSAPPDWSRPLTLDAIAIKAGCNKDRAAFDLADAERRGLIESLTPAQAKKLGLKPAGGANGAKRYRCLPHNWATAKPYEAPRIAIVPKSPPLPAPDEAATDAGERATAAGAGRADRAERAGRAEHTRPTRVTMTIKPGQVAKPKLGQAHEYSIQALCSFPVEIDARNKDGVINFLIRQGAANDAGLTFVNSESNQRVTENGVERSFYGHKSDSGGRPTQLAAALADRHLPVAHKFAVSLEARLGTCELDFFLRELDKRLKRSTPITTAVLSDFMDETLAKWQAMEPVNRKYRERINAAEQRAAAIEREREAYWDSPEGRKRVAELEREAEKHTGKY